MYVYIYVCIYMYVCMYMYVCIKCFVLVDLKPKYRRLPMVLQGIKSHVK